ncbi:Z1 domain-containing protein [Pleionea mediterranea]|uniref:Z1 domain-containing protein n=1 Tax=Pleionea mediterranea TaxID=523701 RepID=A0A316FHJ2_9GAMM|nr:Z1 domain-containing protein [Pleionea mediterranea]PWK47909.1 Z1 domain-containing protein [Pleionea mediterranea]
MDLYKLLERTLVDQMPLKGKGPGDFKKLLKKTALYLDYEPLDTILPSIYDGVFSSNPDNDLRNLFGYYLAKFDATENPNWSHTHPNSEIRRKDILQKMNFTNEEIKSINLLNPYHDKSKKTIVITDEFDHWYPGESPQLRFYWEHYASLLKNNNWPLTSIIRLDEATDEIITRLDNPLRKDDKRKAARGLVVGYVQSGKTANFTGVIAKSIDAGYKMIIVLGGILNVLRSQTQRRLDKELLGKNNLMYSLQSHDCPPDYEEDPGWNEFVEYQQNPPTRIERLTNSKQDFSSDFAQKLVPMLAHYDREVRDAENLKKMPVKLMVIKKQKDVLKKLIKELKNVEFQVKDLPVIIIDDESDQASVNTAKISKSESNKRTTINKLIIELLNVFSAPQYIGYTATPAANVLINPSDSKDLFPRDFILTLPRPIGYMGVSDFYDFDEDWNDISEDYSEKMLNESSYIRPVRGSDTDIDNLPKAILSYILSGAIKLFRNANGVEVSVKHHTMLFHSSVKKMDHDCSRAEIFDVYRKLTKCKEYLIVQLKSLYNNDFKRVSLDKCEFNGSLRCPDFSELLTYIDKAIRKVECPNPVRVVNGDIKYQDQLPDFDKEDIWSILVGGAKLSRGYTVEGLTVSFFRRKSGAGDTLMQAGRWFGFRKNYKDLVRLFIGVEEKSGTKLKNIYLDFKDICRDEELFRQELRTYTKLENGKPIRPIDVLPPLPVHGLDPTAANKMQYAKTHVKNLGGTFLHKAANISHLKKHIEKNMVLLKELLKNSSEHRLFRGYIGEKEKQLDMIYYESKNNNVLHFLKSYEWTIRNQLHDEISFIENNKISSSIDRWLIILPKNSPKNMYIDIFNDNKVGVYSREVDSANGKFKAISDPDHVKLCKNLIGIKDESTPVRLDGIRKKENTAILLVYPVILKGEKVDINIESDKSKVRIGFGVFFPKNNEPIDTYIIVDKSYKYN